MASIILNNFTILTVCFLFLENHAADISRDSFRKEQNESTKNVLSCVLPDQPQNGRWFSSTGQSKIGGTIKENETVVIECDTDYILIPNIEYLVCDGKWDSSNFPKCEKSVSKRCPNLTLGEGFNVSCKNSHGEQISCTEATELSTLSYKCPNGFEIPQGLKSSIQCKNGSWEYVPECQVTPEDTELKEEDETDDGMKIVCVYDSKKSDNVKPRDFNASLCTHVIFDSIGLSINGDLITLNASENGEIDLYRQTLDMKKRNPGLNILLSISGYGLNEGHEFPVVTSDPVKRAKLIASIRDFLQTYGFDGVDIHWRYPPIEAKKNYGILIRELKNSIGPLKKLLTATVYLAPTYLGYDTRTMIANLDWINVKCFEFYDEFSKYTGQNSALQSSTLENTYESENYNLRDCSKNWNYYGFGKDKIVVGITFLGRYYTLLNKNSHGLRAPVTGSTNSGHTGLVTYADICQNYTHWRRVWDDEQKNPYKYYENKWLGYDDSVSIKLKASYLKKKRYLGVAVFSIDADDIHGHCGPKQSLLKDMYNVLRD